MGLASCPGRGSLNKTTLVKFCRGEAAVVVAVGMAGWLAGNQIGYCSVAPLRPTATPWGNGARGRPAGSHAASQQPADDT